MRLSLHGPLLAGLLLAHAPAQEGPSPLPRAEALLGERNCTACHGAPEAVVARLAPKAAPLLETVASRVTPAYLRAFLADPHGTKPGTTMPHLLAKLAPADRDEVLDGLVHYLASLGEPLDMAPVSVRGGTLENGRRLFHSVGCVACHEPMEDPWELELPLAEVRAARANGPGEVIDPPDDQYIAPGTLAPPDLSLAFLAQKTTVDALAQFLLDPLAVRPAGRMPSLGLTEKEARAIALYLLGDQSGPVTEFPGGIVREYFEDQFQPAVADFDVLSPKRVDVASSFDITERDRNEHFGFRFTGTVIVPEDGEWTFYTKSDDGSQLWVDGQHVVDNGGRHGMVEKSGSLNLKKGRHSILVTMYEHAGGEGLEVNWSGPGVPKGEIPSDALVYQALSYAPPDATPLELDERLVRRGRDAFTGLGCNACHETGDPRVDDLPKRGTAAGPDLLTLAASGGGGQCVGDAGSTDTRYRLEEDDYVALRELLAEHEAVLSQPLEPAEEIARHLARNNCYGCHRRDGVGGVHPFNQDYFQAAEGADLGDEGRYPPHLTGVGAKLRDGALRAVLLEGDGVRPYVTARMPQFGEANVGWLTEAFAAVDGPEPDPVLTGTLDSEVMSAGHQLVGVDGGLGCIQCHDFAGTASLGIRAADMASMYERIRPGYFARLLRDPGSVNMNTRMAELWVDGKSPVADVLDGDIDAQIEAVWAYLSLGSAMPLPKGLNVSGSAYELVPAGDPLLCGVFMRDVSPRTLCVGFPELTHYAFDMQSSRLAKIWRGRFFNARGTWEGRAGQLELPPSDDVLELPGGMPIAQLASADDAWPESVGREAGYRSRGRRFDAERVPIMRYELDGVLVEERLAPVLQFGGTLMMREFTLSSETRPENLYLRLAVGDHVHREPDGVWAVTGERDQGLKVSGAEVFARGEKQRELVAPLEFEKVGDRWTARVKVEVSW